MSHGHHHEHDSSRNLGVAFLLNLAFTIIEIAGGYWTNSIAILSDALHDGGDCLSLGIAWRLQKLSGRRPDARFTYGYRRLSIVGALVTGLVLVAGLGFVGWSALGRLRDPQEVRAPGMLALAILGVLMNGAAAWRLHHGRSLSEKIATWHSLEDTLGWAAVLIASLAMMIWDIPILDPLLALLISVFVLWNVVRNLGKVALVFLQTAPAGFDVESFRQQLHQIPGVLDSHHTHTWTLDGEHHVFSMHLVMAATCTRAAIVEAKQRVHQMLRELHFEHISIEVELEGESCGACPPAPHTPE
ncbi:MAG: cation transporter [Planctomycetaceae bacterium]|nr:cation transporter [Planctomycetaceae bacterium]